MSPESSSKVANVPGENIALVFKELIRGIAEQMAETNHQFAVDLEVNFESVTVDKKGIPLFTNKATQSHLRIRLATRIIPSV